MRIPSVLVQLVGRSSVRSNRESFPIEIPSDAPDLARPYGSTGSACAVCCREAAVLQDAFCMAVSVSAFNVF